MPVDRVERAQQLGEATRRCGAQVAAVGVDVLAEQRDLAHAVGGQAARPRRRAPRAAARPRARASTARCSTSSGSCSRRRSAPSPGTSRARLAGRWPVKPSNSKKPCAVSESRGQELGELVHLAGAERDVDERELAEDLLLDRLRPAAADADDASGSLALERLRLAEVGDEALVGLLADRARVEEDQVGVARARAPRRSRATRACPSCARSRARSSGTRTW